MTPLFSSLKSRVVAARLFAFSGDKRRQRRQPSARKPYKISQESTGQVGYNQAILAKMLLEGAPRAHNGNLIGNKIRKEHAYVKRQGWLAPALTRGNFSKPGCKLAARLFLLILGNCSGYPRWFSTGMAPQGRNTYATGHKKLAAHKTQHEYLHLCEITKPISCTLVLICFTE